MSNRVAKRLQNLLLEFGETSQSLADVLGWTRAKIERILSGSEAIDLYELHRLAVFFNRAPSWIFYGGDAVPIDQRERFKTLDRLWASAIEHESTEEAEKAAFSELMEGAGKRRTSDAVSREVVDDTLGYWLAEGQHPYRHYYEE